MPAVKSSSRMSRTPFLGLLLAAAVSMSGPAMAWAPEKFEGLSVEVVGQGKPVLMIPGLNSGAEVWRDTCQALQPQVQCHLLQLPGFAGLEPVEGDAFLDGMRDRLLRYVEDSGLERPAVIGHSLGGMLALQMATARPESVGPLVIVDSLPYYPALQNPAVGVEQMRPIAAQMRAGMLASDEASYNVQAEAALAGLVRDPARIGTLKQWGRASQRRTTANAMHDMMVVDLRGQLDGIASPVLVLGSWAAYEGFGATRDSTEAIFRTQYAKLPGVRIEMSQSGYHFLMWDDPQWLQAQVRGFLDLAPAAR